MPCGIKEIGEAWISGSSASALYNIGFVTRHQLWEKFNGIYQDKGISDEALKSMKFGTWFESAVAKYFAQERGLKIRRCGKMAWWRKDTPYFITHPDFLVIGKDDKGRRAAIEVKCVAPFAEGWGEEGTEEIPDYYYFQVQSYFANGVPCDVVYVVCMRGNRIYVYEILPDKEVIEDMIARVKKTHDEFEQGIEPEPTDYKESVPYFANRAKKDVGREADADAISIFDQLLKNKEQQSKLEAEEKELKSKILPVMGEDKALLRDGKKLFYFQYETRESIDKDALKKDFPKVDFDKYTKKTNITKFMVNYPKNTKKKEN